MERLPHPQRINWKQTVEGLGLAFHTIDGQAYWDESACYRFTEAEIDGIEDVTSTLEDMCLQAVQHIIDANLMARMRIPLAARELIVHSWNTKEKNLYGRFDLAYDGVSAPKLLEYNADTPTALLEASVIQWQWLESQKPGADQFNSIHERLIAAWQGMEVQGPIHFAAVADHPEDEGTTVYLQDTAAQAGLDTRFIHMHDIGSDGARFLDLDEAPITTLFKLYPWEWLIDEEFGPQLLEQALNGSLRIIEPAWKMLLSTKAILPVLWEMFPGHENLLKASFHETDFTGDYVKKPIYGREGANVTRKQGGNVTRTEGDYGGEGYVFQELANIPNLSGRYPILGSWVIASEAAGLGIREDGSPITRDTSRFVPHYFE